MDTLVIAVVAVLVIVIAFMLWERSHGRKTLTDYADSWFSHSDHMTAAHAYGMPASSRGVTMAGPAAVSQGLAASTVSRCGNLGSDECPYLGDQ